MDRSFGERSMQSKDPTIADAIDCCAGNSHDAAVRMPFWACARAKRYGVLRLRSTIREANRAAALRMTGWPCCATQRIETRRIDLPTLTTNSTGRGELKTNSLTTSPFTRTAPCFI